MVEERGGGAHNGIWTLNSAASGENSGKNRQNRDDNTAPGINGAQYIHIQLNQPLHIAVLLFLSFGTADLAKKASERATVVNASSAPPPLAGPSTMAL